MTNRLRYHFKTGEFLMSAPDRGFDEQFTTLTPLPETELADSEYFAMFDGDGKVPSYADQVEGAAWVVKSKLVEVTAYNKETLTSEQFDDKTLVTDDYTVIKPEHSYVTWDEELGNWQSDIEKRRTAKNAEIKAWRDSQESNSEVTVTVDGVEWDAGPAARSRIANGLASSYVSPSWTDANNIDQTEYDLQAIFDAIVQRGAEIHQRKREMNEAVNALATYENIDAYVVGWPAE